MVSVRKRGKVYEYRFEIATVEGTRKWITKSGYPTKAEAFKEGAKAYNDFYYNGQKTQLRENMSYADFLDYWIDNYASFNLHYSTTISYINIIKNHVKPRVGFYKLWQLDTRLLQEFINKIYVEYGFSKNYMASILKVVKGSLKYACYTLNYINTNPAEHVHAPRIDKIGKDPAHIFTQEEIERILDRFKGTHSIYYAFLTAYYTGMRVSEVYGLTWDCVDFEKGTILVNKQLRRSQRKGGTYYFSPPKNNKSRTITPAPYVMKLLQAQKVQQAEQRLMAGPAWEDSGLVFTNEFGRYVSYRAIFDSFKRIVKRIGLPDARIHDLRHTYAVNCIRAGDDIKTVQSNLGHATAAFTLDVYGHFTDDMRSVSAQRMEGFITNVLNL